MVSLEVAAWPVAEQHMFRLGKRSISDAHTSRGIELPDPLLVREVAQIIYDKVDFHATLHSIPELLECDACHVFVVHRICLNADEILGFVNLLPEDIEEAVVVLVDLHAPQLLVSQLHYINH